MENSRYTIFLISAAAARACFATATLPTALRKEKAALISGTPIPVGATAATTCFTARRRFLLLDLTLVTRPTVTVMPFFARASTTSWAVALLVGLQVVADRLGLLTSGFFSTVLASAAGLAAAFFAALLAACFLLWVDFTLVTRPTVTVMPCFAKASTTSLVLALGFDSVVVADHFGFVDFGFLGHDSRSLLGVELENRIVVSIWEAVKC